MAANLFNYSLYQLGWFACLLGSAYGYPEEGAIAALMLTLIHVLMSRCRRTEIALIAMAGCLGLALDTVHLRLGILIYPQGQALNGLAPFWILVLWMQFATLLRFALSWLLGRPKLAALLGAVGGPIAFLGGERLGAASLGQPRLWSLGLLALSWGLALPLLSALAQRIGNNHPGRYHFLS